MPRTAPPDGDTFRGGMPVRSSAAGVGAAVSDVRARHVHVRARVVQVGDEVALPVDGGERDHARGVVLLSDVHAEGRDSLGAAGDGRVVATGGVADREGLVDDALGVAVVGRRPARGLSARDGAGQHRWAGLLGHGLELLLGDAVALLASLAGMRVDPGTPGVDACERLDDARVAENLVDGRGLRRAGVALGEDAGERQGGAKDGDDCGCDEPLVRLHGEAPNGSMWWCVRSNTEL